MVLNSFFTIFPKALVRPNSNPRISQPNPCSPPSSTVLLHSRLEVEITFPCTMTRGSLIPLQKGKEAFCAMGSRAAGSCVPQLDVNCFFSLIPACTQHGTTLTFTKMTVLFHLFCWKTSNHQKLLQLLLECQSSNSRTFQFIKLFYVWDISVKIFYFSFYRKTLTLYFESFLLGQDHVHIFFRLEYVLPDSTVTVMFYSKGGLEKESRNHISKMYSIKICLCVTLHAMYKKYTLNELFP